MRKRLKKNNGAEGVQPPQKSHWQDMQLVGPEDAPDGVPKMDAKIVPNTMYRFDGPKLDSLVTVMPDGVHVSWTTCGRCLGYLSSCTCKTGIIHTQGIEWIYIRTLLWQAGILVGEKITMDHHEIRTRGLYWYAPKGSDSLGPLSHVGFVPGTTRKVGKKPLPRRNGSDRPGNGPVTGRKPLVKGGRPARRVKASDARQEPPVDLRDLERHASSRTADLEAAFVDNINTKKKRLVKTEKSSKKPLRKKGKQ